MPKAEDGEPYYQALGPGGQKDDGDGSNWQKTGVFAPENQKKLGAGCVGLTVVIGVAVAITANVVGSGESAPSTGPSGPVGPLAFRGGFFIDPKHSDGTLNGTRMMAVQLVEHAAPQTPHHDPPRLACCSQVRRIRGIQSSIEEELHALSISINETKEEMTQLILKAKEPIYEKNLVFNTSRDELADAEANCENAKTDQANADKEYHRLVGLCPLPGAPHDCAAQLANAEQICSEMNQRVDEAEQDVQDKRAQNDADFEQLQAAKDELEAAENLRTHDIQICLDDQEREQSAKATADTDMQQQRKTCHFSCPGQPPPPPTMVPGNVVKVVGSDDGVSFWTMSGRIKSTLARSLFVDFAPKGGPFNLNGTYSDGDIEWQDHNKWSRRRAAVTERAGYSSSIAGLYLEDGLAEAGTLKGLRMISDREGDAESTNVTVVGTDDGVNFWTIEGTKGDPMQGTIPLLMDFSHVSGTGSAKRLDKEGEPDNQRHGSWTNGEIVFAWEKTCDTILRGEIKWTKQKLG